MIRQGICLHTYVHLHFDGVLKHAMQIRVYRTICEL